MGVLAPICSFVLAQVPDFNDKQVDYLDYHGRSYT